LELGIEAGNLKALDSSSPAGLCAGGQRVIWQKSRGISVVDAGKATLSVCLQAARDFAASSMEGNAASRMSRNLWHAQVVNEPSDGHEYVCRFKAPRTVTADLVDQVTLIAFQIPIQAPSEKRGCGPSNRTETLPLCRLQLLDSAPWSFG
jgi:hypothetical protein